LSQYICTVIGQKVDYRQKMIQKLKFFNVKVKFSIFRLANRQKTVIIYTYNNHVYNVEYVDVLHYELLIVSCLYEGKSVSRSQMDISIIPVIFKTEKTFISRHILHQR
jgi:hypothetical protein